MDRLHLEYSPSYWAIDSIQFSTIWYTAGTRMLVRYFLTFFQNDQRIILSHHIKNFIGLIHWQFMMEVQIHHPCWEIHIVVIPCHQAKSLQATTSSFIFILILLFLELDSNWNTMQQVIIHSIMCWEIEKGLENHLVLEIFYFLYGLLVLYE